MNDPHRRQASAVCDDGDTCEIIRDINTLEQIDLHYKIIANFAAEQRDEFLFNIIIAEIYHKYAKSLQACLNRLRNMIAFPKTRNMGGEEDILQVMGEALYGRQWQTPLSRDLQITDRTIRNWAAGVGRPVDLADRILPLLRARQEQLHHVIALAERLQNR